MKKHIHVAYVHKALSWLYILFAAVFALTYDILKYRASNSELILATSLLCIGLFALHHFLHIGTLKQKDWALNGTRVVALPLLFWFPFGTLLGSYFLISCWGGWNKQNDSGASGQSSVAFSNDVARPA